MYFQKGKVNQVGGGVCTHAYTHTSRHPLHTPKAKYKGLSSNKEDT